jgi:hypothetical protein
MTIQFRSIIVLLAFALLVQNTCPFGAAGKTTVTSSCSNCPSKHGIIAVPDAQNNLVSDSSSIHFPLFIFAVPKTIHTFQLDPIKSERLIFADNYTDALPDGLLRPPRA